MVLNRAPLPTLNLGGLFSERLVAFGIVAGSLAWVVRYLNHLPVFRNPGNGVSTDPAVVRSDGFPRLD